MKGSLSNGMRYFMGFLLGSFFMLLASGIRHMWRGELNWGLIDLLIGGHNLGHFIGYIVQLRYPPKRPGRST